MPIIINEPLQTGLNGRSHFLKTIIQNLPKESGEVWLIKSDGKVRKINSGKSKQLKWHKKETTKIVEYFGCKKPLITNQTINPKNQKRYSND